MAVGSKLVGALIGQRLSLPESLIRRYPDLPQATYRRGGLPVRIAGWALGMPTAEAVTLWRTVFLSPTTPLSAALLLHELRHVHQFLEHRAFPVSYLWQSIRHGYSRNAYEVDARRYSAARLGTTDKDF